MEPCASPSALRLITHEHGMGMCISWRFLPSESESEAEEGVSDVKKCMVEEEEVGKKGAR